MSKRAAGGRKVESEHILLFRKHLSELGLEYEEEVRFHPQRLWRFDFYLPESKIGIEIDGYFRGRHQAFGKDNDKQNAAIMMGYRVLRFSTQAVLRGRAKSFISEHMRSL